MTELIRKWLEENFKLRADATAEETQTLWDSLRAEDRTRAEEACRDDNDDDEDDDDDEDEDEDEEHDKPKKTMHRVTRNSTVTEETRAAEEAERVRVAAEEAGKQATAAERKRAATLKPPRRQRRARRDPHAGHRQRLEDQLRQGRLPEGRPRGPHAQCRRRRQHQRRGDGPHVRRRPGRPRPQPRSGLHGGHPRPPCSPVPTRASRTPATSWAATRPRPPWLTTAAAPKAGQCFTVRGDVSRMISGQAGKASDERRKVAERLLEMGDKYRSMSMMDLVHECNRIEGRAARPTTRTNASGPPSVAVPYAPSSPRTSAPSSWAATWTQKTRRWAS